ncbi:ribonuclease-like protein H, partial [Mycena rebaudengoi]
VDGACKNNGSDNAVAGVGAYCPELGWLYHQRLPSFPRPTSSRAELSAIRFGLERALARQRTQLVNRYSNIFVVVVHSDSQYAVNCMGWVELWKMNAWFRANGEPVQNVDLLEEADNLRLQIERNGGEVHFTWVPREENVEADRLANEACKRCVNHMDIYCN